MKRTETREMLFKALYEIEIQKDVSEEHTDLFLENNEITYDRLYCDHDKHKILLAEGVDLFIDDSIKGLIYNKDACKYHILFSSIINQQEESDFSRASSWIEVRDIVESLINKNVLEK